jgi:tetratricopeptide (TPR) repeat protein
LKVTAGLDVRHPNIPQYNRSKKGLHHLLAAALQEQGKLEEAAAQYLIAIEKQRMVVSQSNDSQWHEVWLRGLELAYGKLLRELGKFEEARELLEATAQHLEQLSNHPTITSNDRHRDHTEMTLAQTYLTWASVEESLGNESLERELLRKAEDSGS